jgi:hypothetical protein
MASSSPGASERSSPASPVICVTGYANVVEDREYCDVVLQKPYHTATIAWTLAKVTPHESRT